MKYMGVQLQKATNNVKADITTIVEGMRRYGIPFNTIKRGTTACYYGVTSSTWTSSYGGERNPDL